MAGNKLIYSCCSYAQLHTACGIQGVIPLYNMTSITIMGDKGYPNATLQKNLFDTEDIVLEITYRLKQRTWKPPSWAYKRFRKRIETVFSHLNDTLMVIKELFSNLIKTMCNVINFMKSNILYLLIVFSTCVASCQDESRLKTYMTTASDAIAEGNTEHAVRYLKRAANLAPDNFVPLYLMGFVYSEYLDDTENAAKYYTNAMNLINENTVPQKFNECFGEGEDELSYRAIMTEIYSFLAEYSKDTGETEQAKRYYDLNIRLNIASGHYVAPVASSLQQIFFCYRENGEWDACLDYFAEIQTIIPRRGVWEGMCESLCHAVLGDCYLNLGQENEALVEYQHAARLGHQGAINLLNQAGISY